MIRLLEKEKKQTQKRQHGGVRNPSKSVEIVEISECRTTFAEVPPVSITR